MKLNYSSLGGLIGLVYGDPYSGKTTFAASAGENPLTSPVLFADTDKGLKSLTDTTNIMVADISSTEHLRKIAEQVIAGNKEYQNIKTVVLDSGTRLVQTELLTIAQAEYDRGQRKDPTEVQLQDYKKMTARISRVFDMFRAAKVNLIITAGLKDFGLSDDNPDKFTERLPDFPNKLGKQFSHGTDFVWYFYRTNDGNYYAVTYPRQTPWGGVVFAKTRNELLQKQLAERSVKDSAGNPTSTIPLGKHLDTKVSRFGFSDLFNLWKQTTTEIEDKANE